MDEAPVAPVAPPDARRVIASLIYAAPEPLSLKALRKILIEVAATADPTDPESAFAGIGEAVVSDALDSLRRDLEERPLGIQLVEVADGYRFLTDPECAPWLRHVLNTAKPARLSRPALETLAIIAYRQPVARAEIEAVRGVSVDHVVRTLMELQVVRIVGRSELPGKPLLYGTTQKFLEHFGIREVRDLPGIAELARRDTDRLAVPLSAPATQTVASPDTDAAPETAGATPVDSVEDDEPPPEHLHES